MHMATNSLGTNMLYSLDVIGGPKLVRPSNYMSASLIRASCNTFIKAQEQISKIKGSARLGSTIGAAAKESLAPEGWDSDPFCVTHANARKGLVPNSGAEVSDAVFADRVIRNIRAFRDNGCKGSL